MILNNPTRLRIGMNGNFSGTDYLLVGRVVMGVTDDGETYYWNEFNLESPSGKNATLVYEVTERGGVWRLFTEFEPQYPLTAEIAATKALGDQLNLSGTPVRITFRDSSRVYFIEGKAPKSVAVGQVAKYFNAEAVGVMQVVSWTGAEVEYFQGVKLSPGVVNSAFNLPLATTYQSSADSFSSAPDSSQFSSSTENYLSPVKAIAWAALAISIFVFIFIFGNGLSCSRSHELAPVKKIIAGPPPLTVGAAGNLQGKHYRITGHAVVEMDEVGVIYERHEYQLADDLEQTARLVCGQKSADKHWTLFTTLAPKLPPPTTEYAAKKVGDQIAVDDDSGTVRHIFRSFVRETDGATSEALLVGQTYFGLLAESGKTSLLIRWTSAATYFERGSEVPGQEVKTSFSNPSGK